MVTIEDIRQAAERVAGVIRPTPLDRSDNLSRFLGRPVALKPEHLQRTGSFKIRGATNLVSQLPPGTEVVAASAGNHAQGVALAASRAGLAATVFMPRSAALPKVEATRNYGATVHLGGDTVDDAIAAARAYAAARPAGRFVPPFDDPLVIAGQGTIGLELAEEAPDAEVVLVPVGGGGLISGVAAALAGTGARVVGVQADGAAAMKASLAAGHPVTLDAVSTMADGIAIKGPSQLTYDHVQAFVDEIVTVDEDAISQAVVLLLERAKSVVEPAGAVSLAALMAGRVGGTGLAVALLSGGNVDPFLLLRLIDRGLSASGRYLILRVLLSDRPGALAALTARIAAMDLNVLAVEHHRSGMRLAVEQVEVVITVETRDPGHRDSVVEALRAAGYPVELVR
ncbi:MAG TPA: threonine ammonia-lyase [Acidimicrobiales bacterium]|nr:threonine ammonia-lyase [Acidimicrobiales bacterium]